MSVRDLAADWGARYRYRPLAFLNAVVPWGKGTWKSWKGPWEWQKKFAAAVAEEMVRKGWGPGPDGTVPALLPIQRAISSCTGSGKTSLLLPWMIYWQLCSWSEMRGLVLAPTMAHIKDHALPALKIMRDSSPILKQLFTITESGIVTRNDAPAACFCALRSAEEGPKVTGSHGQGAMAFLYVDDPAGVDDGIMTGAAGIATDPQTFEMLIGNPLKNYGFFHDAIMGRNSQYYRPIFISKKDLPTWLPEMMPRLIDRFGDEDSDTFRPNVLGLPPLLGSGGFISRAVIEQAMTRPLEDEFNRRIVPDNTPTVCGIDLAREGEADNCAVWRAGVDARTVRPRRISGKDLNPEDRVGWAMHCATEPQPPYGRASVTYYDSTGLDGMFEAELQRNRAQARFIPVNFGMRDPGGRYLNRRAALWSGFRQWLNRGGCIRRDERLLLTLAAAKAEYKSDRLYITSKEDMRDAVGRDRLDEVDALLLASLAGRSLPASDRPRSQRSWAEDAAAPPENPSWMGV